jgi:hypothetical protein
MPKFTPNFSNSHSANALILADQWIEWFRENVKSSWKGGPGDMEGWGSQQKCVFLERLLVFSKENGPFSIEILERLDLAYGLTASGNSEIKFRWQMLCLESDAPWIVPHVISFVKSQGRMKFVRSLYRALHQSGVGAGIARSTFVENNEMCVAHSLSLIHSLILSPLLSSYHPIARKMVAQDLGVNLNTATASRTPAAPAAPATPRQPIKILQSDPAPVDSESSSAWLPLVLTVGALGLAAAFVLNKNK